MGGSPRTDSIIGKGQEALISQTDANGKRTTLSYDRLGRVTGKTYDADGDNPSTAEWVYDSAGGAGLGKLAAMVSPEDPHLNSPCTVPNTTQTSGNRAGRWFTYNPFGDISEAFECVDGETFSRQYEYDDFGRQQVVRYPEVNSSRFAVNYNYTSLGFLQYVSDAADDKVYWQVKAMSAQGQVTDEQTRNGVETISTRNLSTGWLLTQSVTAHADGDNLIQGLKYKFDVFGNLQERTRSEPRDMADSVESFGYDALDRLTSADVTIGSAGYHATDSFHYDDAGNLTQKGGKTYSYTGCTTGGGPHAVCSVDGGTPFSYDANGNLTLGNDRTISYNGANKVSQINRTSTAQGIGADVVKFAYGADGNRVVQSAGTIATGATDFTEAARTVYVGLGDTGKSMYERTTKASTGGGTATEHVHFIYAGGAHGGNAFALRVVTENKSAAEQPSSFDSPVVKYNHFDHLGSVTAMSDEFGRVVGLARGGVNATAFAYDAWGGRRNADGSAADASSLPLQVGHREYTGHETIPSVGLVNMNGRVYDPDLGRFLSPDPNVQFIANLQSYNRYTYAMNNPLRYTDPTGYFLGISTGTLTRIGMIGLGIAACLNPATCVAYTAGMAIYGAVSLYEAGASFGQIVAVTALNIGMSAMTADTGDSAAARITVGMVSSVITSGFTAVIMGRNSLGESLLSTLAWSAASTAAGLAVANAVAASQRSAEEQQGNGMPRAENQGDSGAGTMDEASRGTTVKLVARSIGGENGELSPEQHLGLLITDNSGDTPVQYLVSGGKDPNTGAVRGWVSVANGEEDFSNVKGADWDHPDVVVKLKVTEVGSYTIDGNVSREQLFGIQEGVNSQFSNTPYVPGGPDSSTWLHEYMRQVGLPAPDILPVKASGW